MINFLSLAILGMLLNACVALTFKKSVLQIASLAKQENLSFLYLLKKLFGNFYFLSGFLLYEISLLILLLLLYMGGVAFVFPLLSIGALIIVSVSAHFYFLEYLSPMKIIGLVILIIGLIVLTFSEK